MTTQTQQKDGRPGQVQTGSGAAVSAALAGSAYESHDSTSTPSAQVLTNPNELTRAEIRKMLSGREPNGLDASQCGPWAGAVTDLLDAWQWGGYEAVKTTWGILSHKTPELARLVAGDGPLAGATAKVRRLARVPDQVDFPSIDDAQNLADLAEFTAAMMTAGKVKDRDRKRAVAFAVRSLLAANKRIVKDQGRDMCYLVDDAGALWPLQEDLDPVQATLAKAGLNMSEPAFKWLIGDLRAWGYDHAPKVTLERFWARRAGALYLSCGPTHMVMGNAAGLTVLPNGAHGVHFASETVLPEWQPAPSGGISPLRLAAFQPAVKAPEDVPAYTPEVQRLLLEAWLVALVAGIRPLPILAAIGDRDGGKTRLITAVCQTIFGGRPTTASEDPRDLWTLAVQMPVLGLDNVDTAPPWLADLLAALVTGVSYQRRRMYTNTGLDSTEPVAVPAVSTRTAAFARPDVAQRTLPILTYAFQDAKRQADNDLEREVTERRSEVLTWLALRAVAMLDRIENAGRIPTLPGRFVDFGRVVWAFDQERAYSALEALQQAQALTVGNSDDLLTAIVEHADGLLGEAGQWRGKAAELAKRLTELGAELPYMGGGKAIAGKLREGQGTLALFGLALDWQATGGGHVYFTLKRR